MLWRSRRNYWAPSTTSARIILNPAISPLEREGDSNQMPFPQFFPQPLQSYFDQFFNLEVSVCLCLICLLAKVVSVCLSLSAFKSQESDDDSIYPASFASTQKTESSQVGTEYQDNIDEDNREEEGEVDGEEEEEDAAIVLVRKESLWPLLKTWLFRTLRDYVSLQRLDRLDSFFFFFKCPNFWKDFFVSDFPFHLFTTGAQLVAKMTCNRGHNNEWTSCPNVGTKKTSAATINVDLTSSIFLSGLRFDRVKVNLYFHSCQSWIPFYLLKTQSWAHKTDNFEIDTNRVDLESEKAKTFRIARSLPQKLSG